MTTNQFSACFEQLTGHPPFRWQTRLFERLCTGDIPARCDIPTGLGKTSVLALWLLALAEQAAQSDAALTLPRRLAYIVDRRVVVDQATDEAERLLVKLLHAPDGPLATVADALRSLAASPGGSPFELSTLRGALADNRRWSRDPARPAIIIGTVDMIGSRLLFSGYGGLGPYNRSQHAALLGQDTLVVLDEAQLAPAFASTLVEIEQRAKPGRAELAHPFQVMSLTATQPRLQAGVDSEAEEDPPLGLEPADLEQDEVRARVQAPKTLSFAPSVPGENAAALARRMADEAIKLAGTAGAVVIFVDTVDLLDKIHDALGTAQTKVPETHRLRLNGQMRGHERDRFFRPGGTEEKLVYQTIRQRHKQRVGNLQPVFLLATAAGEVGINFNADHAVCNLVPLERMAQRLGRVNRFGDHPAARITVFAVDAPDEAEKKAREETRRRLSQLPSIPGPDGAPAPNAHSASPEALRAILKMDADAGGTACTPFSYPPPLDGARLDDWSMTSLPSKEFPRPQVSYWLRGISPDDAPAVRVAWREELRYASNAEDATDMAQTLPPLPRELVQLPIGRAVKWLLARAKKHAAAIDPHRGQFAVVRPAAGEWTPHELKDFQEKERFERIIAGATIMLPTTFGGLSKDGLPDESADDKVPDVLEADDPDAPGREKLFRRVLLHGSPTSGWTTHDLMAGPDFQSIKTSSSLAESLRKAAEVFDGEAENRRYRLVRRKAVDLPDESLDADEDTAVYRTEYFASTVADLEAADGSDDRSSLRGKHPVMLSTHLKQAESFAGLIAARLGLPDAIRQAVIQAAAWHDLGKHRANWQRAVGNIDDADNPDPAKVWAKSPKLAVGRGSTQGYRHEFGSMMEAAEKLAAQPQPETDLILHLIAAHHGDGRPGFEAKAYDVPKYLAIQCREAAQEAELRFERLQRRFGWWGLAYLEALVKCADALASDAEDDTHAASTSPSP